MIRLPLRTPLAIRAAGCALVMGLCALAAASPAAAATGGYVVVASRATLASPEWSAVAEALREKHAAPVVTFQSHVTEALPELRRYGPRHTGFVARPEEVTRAFVAEVHRLTRQYDDDPYTDGLWGIVTGYDAASALRTARHREPLTIRKVAAGTEVALDACAEGRWFCELTAGKQVIKERGGTPRETRGPADSTAALVQTLNEYQPDLFVTSGHATERDWMIGFRYKNGFFKHQAGRLYGEDTRGNKLPIHSPNPKVYLPVGNCLMGHIDRPDCMAMSWMNSAGVMQMIGYTVPTWYGYAGWGCLDYFVEQPGRYTLAEAFFANQAALIHRLQSFFPEAMSVTVDANGRTSRPVAVSDQARQAGLKANDARGLLFDRDVVAFYGDPAWPARMAPGELFWEQTLRVEGSTCTFEVVPRRGADTFAPRNRNGSQRGGRPLVQFLPHRVGPATLLEGAAFHPVVTDDFLLVPAPAGAAAERPFRIVFRAERLP